MNDIETADDDRKSLAWAIAGATIGAGVALLALGDLVPAIAASLSTPQPKTWWYLSRASGLVSYALMSCSMLLGLLLSTRLGKTWPGGATAFELHQHTSLLAIAVGAIHALVLLGDQHTPFTLAELALPFGARYRPFAIGAGQLALYAGAILVGSSYLRKRIGQRTWRLLHFVSFAGFALALGHGLAAGTDHALVLVGLAPAAAVLFFVIFRLLGATLARDEPRLVGGARVRC